MMIKARANNVWGERRSTQLATLSKSSASLFISSPHSGVDQAIALASQLEAARAEVAHIRQQQEAERARVKKAIAELRRKNDAAAKDKAAREASSR